MKKFVLAVFAVVLLFSACDARSSGGIILLPSGDGSKSDAPDFSKDGYIFYDDFSADSTTYYDPGWVNSAITDDRAENMVISNGKAHFYGGGAHVQWDENLSNNPMDGRLDPGFTTYEMNLSKYTYTVSVSGEFKDFTVPDGTKESKFYGLTVGTRTGDLSFGNGEQGPQTGILIYPGNKLHGDYSTLQSEGEGISLDRVSGPFSIDVTIKKVGSDVVMSSVGTFNSTHFAFSNKATAENISAIFVTVMGPYGTYYEKKGPEFMTLDSVSIKKSPVAFASDLYTGEKFSDDFTKDSSFLYWVENDDSRGANFVVNTEKGVAELYGGGAYNSFNAVNISFSNVESYTVSYSGKIADDFSVEDFTEDQSFLSLRVVGGITSTSKVYGGMRINKSDDGKLLLVADDALNGKKFEEYDSGIEVKGGDEFSFSVTISKEGESLKSVTYGSIGSHQELTATIEGDAGSNITSDLVFLTAFGPYGASSAGSGKMYMELDSVSFTANGSN